MKQTTTPTVPAVGEAIRYLRQQRGLSQSELAHRARLTQATVSRIESGARRGDIETLALIAAALGLALWILIKRAEGTRVLFGTLSR
jgi:transcriptional regulator with XRE-family HTH domain